MDKPEVKTKYMMFKRALVVFKASDGQMRTYVFLMAGRDMDVQAIVSQLLAEAPAKHAKRREHLEKVHAELTETFPQRYDKWVLQREMCMRYELAMSKWRSDIKDYDGRKAADMLEKGEERPSRPECGCDYPLGPEPELPPSLEPDTFNGTFMECVEEIQNMDFEERGLKPIDVSEESETYIFNEE